MNDVFGLLDPITNTISYVVWDPRSRDAVVIDPLMDYDPVTRRTLPWSRQALEHFVAAKNLNVHYILETHAHADHLSAARDLRRTWTGSRWAMSERLDVVFDAFKGEWEWPQDLRLSNLGVDRWLRDGEELVAGSFTVSTIATPGHTPACVTYRIGDWLFVGDALMTPDFGTGRCDFPGGDPGALWDSIARKLYALDDRCQVFSGHDYQPGGRPPRSRWSLGEHKQRNIHVTLGTRRAEFVTFRRARDLQLKAPGLLPPSLDWNLGAHQLVRPTTEQMIRWF